MVDTRISLPNLPQAACKGLDTAMFFRDATLAKAVCRRCPDQEACLAYALPDSTLYGVWGAHTAEERRRIREARRATTRLCARCGHRRTPCRTCLTTTSREAS